MTPRIILIFAAMYSVSAQATWSIVAVDPDTGQVGLTAATCGLGVQFIAEAVPGAGVVAAQAATSFKGRDQAREWMAQGVGAEEILSRLSDPEFYDGWFAAAFADLQYGVATLTGAARAGFVDGDNLLAWSGGISGATFSVQGNALRGEAVVTAAADAFEVHEDGSCRLTFEERLLRALEAGRDAGGDNRCPLDRPAQSAILLIGSAPRVNGGLAAYTKRIVTPKEIGLIQGMHYSLFPYEPDTDEKEPVQSLRERFEASGGKRCQ